MFESVFGVTDTATTSTVSLVPFLASVGVALALGLALEALLLATQVFSCPHAAQRVSRLPDYRV